MFYSYLQFFYPTATGLSISSLPISIDSIEPPKFGTVDGVAIIAKPTAVAATAYFFFHHIKTHHLSTTNKRAVCICKLLF